jgi:hypothetical protein
MKNLTDISLKKLWTGVNGLLLFIAAFALLLGEENVFGFAGTILMLLSFPLNLLVGWLFFAFGDVFNSPVALFLMTLLLSVTGYLQWFVLVPKLVKFLSRKATENNLDFGTDTPARRLAEPAAESVDDWQGKYYDEQNRTPVERIFDR